MREGEKDATFIYLFSIAHIAKGVSPLILSHCRELEISSLGSLAELHCLFIQLVLSIRPSTGGCEELTERGTLKFEAPTLIFILGLRKWGLK